MIILPAIDMYESKVVRLYKGDYGRMTVYSDDIVSVAMKMEDNGATHLHMVDLKGAREGSTPDFESVKNVCRYTNLKVEIGGGIRDMDTVERYLDAGAEKVIIGTGAVTDKWFVENALERFTYRVAVGVDVREGYVAVNGWTDTTGWDMFSFIDEMKLTGATDFIVTDISRDGAMNGTNRELYSTLSADRSIKVTASGGVSSYEDIRRLMDTGVYGAIIGKALYTGDIDLSRALDISKAGKEQ